MSEPASSQTNSIAYANACRAEIGEIASFSCADGAVVPITVDNKVVEARKDMICDRPALLSNGAGADGQCVPNTRILSLSDRTAQVSVMCRQKHVRPASSLIFDEIDLVAHNPVTGATCWFQAGGEGAAPVDGRRVPSPTRDDTSRFWAAPETTVKAGCGNCHGGGPLMYSPFVGQVWNRLTADPLGPYFHVDPSHIGFDAWHREVISPRDNACIGCHRIGVGEGCGELTPWMTGRAVPAGADAWAKSWPGSHAMPPDPNMTLRSWGELYDSSVDQIVSCCKNPNQNACGRIPISRAPG